MCNVWKKEQKIAEELTLPEIEGIFKQLKKINVLRITGGEPFLRQDLAEIINKIEKINSPELIHITSNGILTEQIIEIVKKIECPEKIHIKISIDSIGKKHDEIRGITNAYDKAMETVKRLVELRGKTHLHVGVNQTIVEEKEIDSYSKLKKILEPLKVPVYPVIATDTTGSLYNDEDTANPNNATKTFTPFSKDGLKKFINEMLKDSKKMNNLEERIVDRYHLKGLYNRLVNNKNKPNPKCVALNNHLRILPNGDIPVCLYNGNIVGNLKRTPFKDIWFGKDLKKYRTWVKNCQGCWFSCESAVSGIYTGDIWKGLL